MSNLVDNYTYVLRANDTDYKSDFYPTQVLDYFQTIAGRHATKMGIGFREFKDLNLCWVLVKTRYKVYKKVEIDSIIELTSWPLQPNRIEYNRCYRINDLNGELVIEGLSKWCIVDYVNHKISRYQAVYPGEFIDDNVSIEFDKLYLRENVLDSEVLKSYTYKFSHKVLKSDLDMNSHMNNAKYANLVYDAIDETLTISEFEIDYVNQSLLDDIIDVYTKEVDDKLIVVGINKEKNQCIFKSIVLH